MVKYYSADQPFEFPSSFGFSKSATPVATNRSRLATGGQPEAPGPSPAAGMQPMTRKPTKAPLANATVSMPAPDFAKFTGSAVKAGMKMGALAASASPKIHPGPGIMASPAAQAPEEVTPMRKGGRVKRANGGEIDVDQAADEYRKQDYFTRVRPGYLDTGDSIDTKPPSGDERFEVRKRPPQRGPERELAKGGPVRKKFFLGGNTSRSAPFGPFIDDKTGSYVSPAELNERVAKMPHVNPAPPPSAPPPDVVEQSSPPPKSSNGGFSALSTPRGQAQPVSKPSDQPSPSGALTTTSGSGWGSNISDRLKEMAAGNYKKGGRVKRASGGVARSGSRKDDRDWKDIISRQGTNPGDDNMELNAGLPRTAKMPNAAESDLDASRDGERLYRGGRVKRAMGGPMMQPSPMPMAAQGAPMMAQPGVPNQPAPVTATMALPMPHMAKGGPVRRKKLADGGKLDADRFASDQWADRDQLAERRNGKLTDAQAQRYVAARRAMTSAQENMNDARDVPRDYNGGKRFTSPDDATDYHGFAKGGHFIQSAIKHPGALHRDLGVPQGQKIPGAKLEAARHSENPTIRKRANFAVTLKRISKGRH